MNQELTPDITKDQFDEFFKRIQKSALERMSEKTESLLPELVVLTKKIDEEDSITCCLIATPFNEDKEKRQCLYRLGCKFYAEQMFPAAIALHCEAWMAKHIKGGVQPRHAASRREVIMIAAKTFAHGYNRAAFIPVKRDAENLMVQAGDIQITDSNSMPILDWFYKGFFMDIMKKLGMKVQEP